MFELRESTDWIPGESSLSGWQVAPFLLCPHMAEIEKVLVALPLFKRALIPLGGHPYLSLINTQGPHLQMSPYWKLELQLRRLVCVCVSQDGDTFQSTAGPIRVHSVDA